MAGKIISILFNFVIGFLATVIQIVVYPLNQLITTLLPDLSASITSVTTGIGNLMQTLPWALSILPLSYLITLITCWTIRLAVQNIHISTHTILRVWNVLQKIKFW